MSIWDQLDTSNELAKKKDRSTIKKLDRTSDEDTALATAIQAAGNLHVYSDLEVSECIMRPAIISSVKLMDIPAKGKDGTEMPRYATIGRDTKTNATLRGWITCFDDQTVIPTVGDAHKLPAFHLLKDHAMFAWNGDVIVAKNDNVFQAVSILTAEKMSAEQFHFHSMKEEALAMQAETADVQLPG